MRKISTKSRQNHTQPFAGIARAGHNLALRLFILISMFGLVLVSISLRLFHLQVVHGADYRLRSDNNRILVRSVPPARGVIYDRNGEALVMNQPVQRLLTNDKGQITLDSAILNRDQVLSYEATDSARLVSSVGRYYPFHDVLAHVVGYVAEANQEELEEANLSIGEMVGKEGLEKSLNQELMGVAGSELIEVDARGKVLRRVTQKKSIPGRDVYLNLDSGLQEKLYQLFEGRAGAAVVSNPQNGAVYALVSSPSYDPNIFGYSLEELGVEKDLVGEPLAKILTSEKRYLLNRSIAGTYPPGSVYKVVPSIAALEEEAITSATEIEDTGVLEIDEYSFRNWYFTKYGRTDGQVDLRKALQRSNDIYYYEIGEAVGIDALASWSRKFGLGERTGIDLGGEQSGLVPDPLWKERVKDERWYLGNTYHMSIGQGDLLTTPLQVQQMMGVIANGGKKCRPLLVAKIGDATQTGSDCYDVGISPVYLAAVNQGLIAACEPGGTGVPFFEFSLHELDERFSEDAVVACKTGTAQFFDPEDRTHAWFTIYAPSEKPEIMITVLLEAAGEGSEEAAPVAKEALEYWLENK